MASYALSAGEMEPFDGLFRGLMRGEAGPIVAAIIARSRCLFKIVLRLGEPIPPSLRHPTSPSLVTH